MRAATFCLSSALVGVVFWASVHLAYTQEITRQVVIEVCGDVLPESSWQERIDPEHLFDGMKDEFARSDLVFVNLEEPITRSNRVTRYKRRAAVRAKRDYILRARNPRIPEVLKNSGIGLVGLANNHMMDFAAVGLSDTLAGFRSAGLPTVGAGLVADAERAYIFEKGGVKVALLAFSDVIPTNYAATPNKPGVASSQDEARLRGAIQEARKQADFVILMIHWGAQGDHRITHRQRALARVAVEAGCDVVVGMHPHVIQGIEYFGRVPVFYSIGNFSFPSIKPAEMECFVAKLCFRPNHAAAVELVPAEISARGAPTVAQGKEATGILSHLDQYCRGFNTAIRDGKLVEISPRQVPVYDKGKRARRRRSS
ncbi:MAG: hypothetical protein DMG21_01670 [Acidobacteria bacterium]|nr:MAG: hypothetical protein DMG21_01670 [Acidobacteriota bacterium]